MSTTLDARRSDIRQGFTRGRLAFRHWRWSRPFWAGLFTILGGVPIMYFPYANMHIGDLTIRMATTAGMGSAVIGVLLVTLGLTMWFQSATRVFAGVATLVLVLVSLVVSNFGGFLIGYLLGLFGGGMSIAWMPGTPASPAPHGDDGAGEARPVVPPVVAAYGTGSALAEFAALSGSHGDDGKEKQRAQ